MNTYTRNLIFNILKAIALLICNIIQQLIEDLRDNATIERE